MAELFDFKALGTYLHFKFIFQAKNWQFASGISVNCVKLTPNDITYYFDH
jgi:hypothetical protein